jgi:hypothetical protein
VQARQIESGGNDEIWMQAKRGINGNLFFIIASKARESKDITNKAAEII